jgi:hypothetical protein
MIEEKKHSPVPGIVFIVIGLVLLIGNIMLGRLDTDVLWTYIVIVLGIIFWIAYLVDRSRISMLMPGTVLITIGIVLNYCVRTNWTNISVLIAFIILAPAFGFYLMFLLGKREKGLLIPAGILTILGVLQLFQGLHVSIGYLLPIFLILIGVLMLVRKQ